VRVLFLSAWFPYPADNGSKLRAYHLLRALGQEHEVTLVSFAFATARPEQPGDLRSLCADIQVVPVDPFAANRAGTLRTFLSARPIVSRPIPAMSHLVSGVLRRNAYGAVIASTEMMADYALQAPPRVPRVLEEHNSMTRWMRERYEGTSHPLKRLRSWASWRKRHRYEMRYYPRFDLVTMVSEADRATTLETVGQQETRIEVVPNGVDCAHNLPGLARSEPEALIYSGALTYSANYHAMRWFLAEIFSRIRAECPGTTLTITGSTRGVDLNRLGLDNSVRLTGFLDDVRLAVARAQVAVAPILWGGGTRLKILEAMALGTPVVATSKAAEGLDVTHGLDILIANEPAEFADQVVRLLRDPNLRDVLARNGRALVEERYDWQAIGQRFVDLVEKVALERGSR
jgi:glycosyltransferase involved in cell wall biosynthesis